VFPGKGWGASQSMLPPSKPVYWTLLDSSRCKTSIATWYSARCRRRLTGFRPCPHAQCQIARRYVSRYHRTQSECCLYVWNGGRTTPAYISPSIASIRTVSHISDDRFFGRFQETHSGCLCEHFRVCLYGASATSLEAQAAVKVSTQGTQGRIHGRLRGQSKCSACDGAGVGCDPQLLLRFVLRRALPPIEARKSPASRCGLRLPRSAESRIALRL